MGGHGWGFLFFIVGVGTAFAGGYILAHRVYFTLALTNLRDKTQDDAALDDDGATQAQDRHESRTLLLRSILFFAVGVLLILISFLMMEHIGIWVVILSAVLGATLYHVIKLARK